MRKLFRWLATICAAQLALAAPVLAACRTLASSTVVADPSVARSCNANPIPVAEGSPFRGLQERLCYVAKTNKHFSDILGPGFKIDGANGPATQAAVRKYLGTSIQLNKDYRNNPFIGFHIGGRLASAAAQEILETLRPLQFRKDELNDRDLGQICEHLEFSIEPRADRTASSVDFASRPLTLGSFLFEIKVGGEERGMDYAVFAVREYKNAFYAVAKSEITNAFWSRCVSEGGVPPAGCRILKNQTTTLNDDALGGIFPDDIPAFQKFEERFWERASGASGILPMTLKLSSRMPYDSEWAQLARFTYPQMGKWSPAACESALGSERTRSPLLRNLFGNAAEPVLLGSGGQSWLGGSFFMRPKDVCAADDMVDYSAKFSRRLANNINQWRNNFGLRTAVIVVTSD
ncbi:MAG: hypothetical protein RIC14_02430 [Filomicrobium sp.]